MSRIKARIIPNKGADRVGRLVPMPVHPDAGEKIAEFHVPSLSRDERLYICQFDWISTELVCACEDFQINRLKSDNKRHRINAGSYLEQLTFINGYAMLPTVTRKPNGLCPHLQKVQRFIRRHVPKEAIEQIEKSLIERLESRPRTAAKAA